jgi:sarcosine oxidase, subunit gamma
MSDAIALPALQSPLHALGLESQAEAMTDTCGVWANEVPLLGYISLRGSASDTQFLDAAKAALGQSLALEPCTFTQNGAAKVIWLSPDEWMISCPRDRHAALLASLNDATRGLHAQAADNSGGYTQILIKGRNAQDVLSHCTVYDVAHLAEGRAVGTTFGKASCYVHRAGDGYCLLIRRSFADYIWRYLARAAVPYGFGIAKFGPGQLGAAA